MSLIFQGESATKGKIDLYEHLLSVNTGKVTSPRGVPVSIGVGLVRIEQFDEDNDVVTLNF